MRLDHLLSKESHRYGGVGSCASEGCVSLLSLIPRLIKQRAACLGGGLWVWLGGTLLLLGSNMFRCFVAGGLAHCWVLRRHLLWVLFSGAAPGFGCLTQPVVGVVVVVSVLGCGCVLSVA